MRIFGSLVVFPFQKEKVTRQVKFKYIYLLPFSEIEFIDCSINFSKAFIGSKLSRVVLTLTGNLSKNQNVPSYAIKNIKKTD